MNDCYYIAEINLPSRSAYAVHVMQMCNALSKKGFNVTLIIPSMDKKNAKKIKKDFAIKYDFKINPIFNNIKNLNFLSRLLFGILSSNFLINKKSSLIISRSIISSIFLSKKKIFNYLEIHHELKGLTNLIYKYYINKIIKNIKFILLHKNLVQHFNFKKKNYLVLDDAVNINLFKNHNIKKYKKTCAYFGSLSKGKGVEIIKEVASEEKNINFHIYGDLKLLDKSKKKELELKNIKLFNYVVYKDIPKLMSKYDIVLMPYQKKVSVRSKNLETSNYMSPLKLFEYLSMSLIIVATKLKVYEHVLKHKKNSILIPLEKVFLWKKTINYIFKNIKKFNKIKLNAKKTAQKYTWDIRVKKIIYDFNNLKTF